MKRKALSLTDKVAILTRQALCGLCGEPLGKGPIDWHHPNALAISGDDSIENRMACHADCHDVSTFGAPTKASNRESDIGVISHVRRLGKTEEAFRARLMTKEAGKAPERPVSRLKGRGFPKRNGALTRGREGA